jgi:hypothetical protein
MDEETFRAILKAELATFKTELRSEMTGLKTELRGELQAMEGRLAENGRMMFRQLADLYRGTNERMDRMEKNLSDQIGQTRGAIESLRSSVERLDFRLDEHGRRITALETRPIE